MVYAKVHRHKTPGEVGPVVYTCLEKVCKYVVGSNRCVAEDVQFVLRDPCSWCAQIDVMNVQTGRGIKEALDIDGTDGSRSPKGIDHDVRLIHGGHIWILNTMKRKSRIQIVSSVE